MNPQPEKAVLQQTAEGPNIVLTKEELTCVLSACAYALGGACAALTEEQRASIHTLKNAAAKIARGTGMTPEELAEAILFARSVRSRR